MRWNPVDLLTKRSNFHWPLISCSYHWFQPRNLDSFVCDLNSLSLRKNIINWFLKEKKIHIRLAMQVESVEELERKKIIWWKINISCIFDYSLPTKALWKCGICSRMNFNFIVFGQKKMKEKANKSSGLWFSRKTVSQLITYIYA